MTIRYLSFVARARALSPSSCTPWKCTLSHSGAKYVETSQHWDPSHSTVTQTTTRFLECTSGNPRQQIQQLKSSMEQRDTSFPSLFSSQPLNQRSGSAISVSCPRQTHPIQSLVTLRFRTSGRPSTGRDSIAKPIDIPQGPSLSLVQTDHWASHSAYLDATHSQKWKTS